MYRGGLSAPISSAGGMAKAVARTCAGYASNTKRCVSPVRDLALDADRTTAGGHPLRQHSCRHPEPAPWRCRGQLMPIWAIAISVAGVQAIREGTVIPQVSPAIAGRAVSNATKPTPTSWKTFFIRLRKTIHGAALCLGCRSLRPLGNRMNEICLPGGQNHRLRAKCRSNSSRDSRSPSSLSTTDLALLFGSEIYPFA